MRKSINEIVISGDNITVKYESGKIKRITINKLDAGKFNDFKQNLDEYLKDSSANPNVVRPVD